MDILTAGPVDSSVVTMCNNKVAHCHFISETRQLFETEEGSFLFKMDEQKLVLLHPDKYTTLLLKLMTTFENHELSEQAKEYTYRKNNNYDENIRGF